MNIKDSIDEVKRELTTDEQMLISAFKLEKFYKRHKIKILSTLIIAVLLFSGIKITTLIKQYRLNSANEAYLTLLQNRNNIEALKVLKDKNPKLFELYNYKIAVESGDIATLEKLKNSKDEIIADISRYHLSVLKHKKTSSYLYEDMAIMNNANIYIREGKISEAKNQLALINENSPLFNTSKIIKHYTIKGR